MSSHASRIFSLFLLHLAVTRISLLEKVGILVIAGGWECDDRNVLRSKSVGTKHALQCGGLTQAWHEWQRLPAVQHNWLNWKNYWMAALNEQHDISHLIGGMILHQANAVVDDDQWSTQMITSLDNMANAAVQKNDTVERLVLANKLLKDTVAKL
ncbi:hypothetical protein ACHAW6_012249 [Cyclotella cf. meneghiniana]